MCSSTQRTNFDYIMLSFAYFCYTRQTARRNQFGAPECDCDMREFYNLKYTSAHLHIKQKIVTIYELSYFIRFFFFCCSALFWQCFDFPQLGRTFSATIYSEMSSSFHIHFVIFLCFSAFFAIVCIFTNVFDIISIYFASVSRSTHAWAYFVNEVTQQTKLITEKSNFLSNTSIVQLWRQSANSSNWQRKCKDKSNE